ncbi:hypothetical protein E2562_026794 [Oryza meyeriana var. granulata]|uniref:Uncharacterized protein n=1 Tax=Oryza meyeriana var. granulata TaxID=110450 RepID=A0A6G1CT42_9ORYZ|nr:hypothetical protein E2562_026794 [Oryza meyeriana var. granulata]
MAVTKKALPSSSTEPGHGRVLRASGVASMSMHKGLEGVEEEEDEQDNSFDKNDELSVSLLTSEGEDVVELLADEVQKAKRGCKRLKAGAGVSLSPSKCKVARGKRAGYWKYFKVINVPSKKEEGVMLDKENV